MRPLLAASLLSTLLLAACGVEGPSLAGQEGLQFKVTSYYRDHATEEGGVCRAPRMQGITRTTILAETEETLEIEVRYSYIDEAYMPDSDGSLIVTPYRCQGFAQRVFTVSKSEGVQTVTGMTGDTRHSKNFSR